MNVKRCRYILLLLSILCLQAFGQINTNKPIILNSQDKQIYNLGTPTAVDHAVNVKTLQDNTLLYSTASGTDTIAVNLTPALTAYERGTTVYLKAANTNTGAVLVNVNQLGLVPVKKNVNRDLTKGNIRAGEIIAIVFDGVNFQLISNNVRSCPSGFVDVNSDYCIEQNERAAQYFFPAQVICSDLGYRLCSWGEWYYACQNTSLSLNTMTNNYEWTNDSANEDDYVRVVGNNSCKAAGNLNGVTFMQPFRCCFSK